MNKKVTKEELINDLKRVYEKVQCPPTKNMYDEIGEFSRSTYIRMWGSWNTALKDIIGLVNSEERPRKELECPVCKNMFFQNDYKQRFCSKKCSLEYVNKINTSKQRVKTKKCISCEDLIFASRMYCKKCYNKITEERQKEIGERTLKESEIRKDAGKYQRIRNNAQTIINKSGIERKCLVCGYGKHVEVCHKKSIGSFSPDTKIREINDLNNLALLCPTHHWELDHGLLENRNAQRINSERFKNGGSAGNRTPDQQLNLPLQF